MELTKPSTPTKRVPGGKGGRKGRTEDSDETLAYAALKASTHSSSFERQGRNSIALLKSQQTFQQTFLQSF